MSAFAAVESDAAGMTESDGTVTVEMVLDVDDMAYYRRGRTIVKHIVAGNHASAERGILRLRKLNQPQAEVLADVHIAIGMAYGESGHFDASIAHLEKALDLEHDLWPGVAAESRAYLVYLHAASGRFEMAQRLLGSGTNMSPWLFAKLASVYAGTGHYDCAAANVEKALRIGRIAGPVAPVGAWHLQTDAVNRDAVLGDWSEMLQTLRRKGGSSLGETLAFCVGG